MSQTNTGNNDQWITVRTGKTRSNNELSLYEHEQLVNKLNLPKTEREKQRTNKPKPESDSDSDEYDYEEEPDFETLIDYVIEIGTELCERYQDEFPTLNTQRFISCMLWKMEIYRPPEEDEPDQVKMEFPMKIHYKTDKR